MTGEGDPLHRDGAPMGHPPEHSPAKQAARARVHEGPGTPRLDPHPGTFLATILFKIFFSKFNTMQNKNKLDIKIKVVF